jgi:RES domain-containing protein
VIVWRIAADTRSCGADDLSGMGAAKRPGRWNEEGQPALYTSPSIAIALLETAAHVDDGGLPMNRYLVEITVPAALWTAREILDTTKLSKTWSAIPAGRGSVKPGSDWLRGMTAAILVVPSVIVPEEPATLINPKHPDAAGMSARIVRLIEYNRFFRASSPAIRSRSTRRK